MEEFDVLELYRSHGAFREGHFRLSSGLHSNRYFQSALVLARPRAAEQLGKALAGRFAGESVDVVMGPALGAIVIAHEVARALDVPALFAERVDDRFLLRRGFELESGARVLLVEDVLTTGRSVRQLVELLGRAGATVAGIGCLVDRGANLDPLPTPVTSLARVRVDSWQAQECPLCGRGVPVDVPGSRKIGRARI